MAPARQYGALWIGPITVGVSNVTGQHVKATSSVRVALKQPRHGRYYLRKGGRAVTSVVVQQGKPTTSVYYTPTKAGKVRLAATAFMLGSATLPISVRR